MTATVRIPRNPEAVADRAFDVVIAGAGIYGALSAVEAAARGLRALLVERADFGGGTSFNSLRTVHGGLRYLQRLDFVRAKSSSRQRDWWLRHFPDLVVPISCLMPLYGRGLHRPAAFRTAFAMTRLLGLNGAKDLRADRRLDAPRLLSAAEVRERAPAVPPGGLEGGALWSDALMADSSRIIIESLRWAAGAGALILNYAELERAGAEAGGLSRLRILDRVSGEELTVTTRNVINATGPSVDDVARRLGGRVKRLLLPTIAWNLLLDVHPPSRCSLAVTPPGRGDRTYFVHPFHGRVLAGTGHAVGAGAASAMLPSADMLRSMRSDLEAALPGAGLGEAFVLRVLAGTLPGVHPASSRLATRPRIVRDSATGGATIWHIVGVKFTEAPAITRKVLAAVADGSSVHLPQRPEAATGWNVLDGSNPVSRSALLELAASESAIYLEDLIERRTNAWCDEAARRRIEALVGNGFDRHTSNAVGPILVDSHAED